MKFRQETQTNQGECRLIKVQNLHKQILLMSLYLDFLSQQHKDSVFSSQTDINYNPGSDQGNPEA